MFEKTIYGLMNEKKFWKLALIYIIGFAVIIWVIVKLFIPILSFVLSYIMMIYIGFIIGLIIGVKYEKRIKVIVKKYKPKENTI